MNCPKCGAVALFVRERPFADGSGKVYTCKTQNCPSYHLYFYDTQPELPISHAPAPDADAFRAYLANHQTWCTRRELGLALGWTERRVRDAAEQLGQEVIRSQAGFKLVAHANPADYPLAIQASDAAISQGKKMI